MLRYNDLECGWECTNCGALYDGNELARMFDYKTTDAEEQKLLADKGKFTPCYCMDCGTFWEEVK